MGQQIGQALETLLIGWGGIFLVMAVLFGATKGLLKVFPPKQEQTELKK